VVVIDAASQIAEHSEAELWLDTRRMHLFDPHSGDNLTRAAS
jgi:multiple sugar transport system ATP-binding protein